MEPEGNGGGARHYNRPIDVLCVCTANMCRSPLLEVFLDAALRGRGVDAVVHSAGTLAEGGPAVPEVVDVALDRGYDLRAHTARRLDRDLIRGADLVLPLAREHLREVVVAVPEAFARTFTPKELVRRAGATGGRRPDEALGAFLARLHEGRRHQELLRNDPVDDVLDPIGGPRSGYVRAATELESLAFSLAELLDPSAAVPTPATTPAASPFQET